MELQSKRSARSGQDADRAENHVEDHAEGAANKTRCENGWRVLPRAVSQRYGKPPREKIVQKRIVKTIDDGWRSRQTVVSFGAQN
jgi:hypothetical protein